MINVKKLSKLIDNKFGTIGIVDRFNDGVVNLYFRNITYSIQIRGIKYLVAKFEDGVFINNLQYFTKEKQHF